MQPRYICFRRSDAFTTTSPEIGDRLFFRESDSYVIRLFRKYRAKCSSAAAPLVPSAKCRRRSNAAHLAGRIFFEQTLLPRNHRRYYHLVTGASFVLPSCLFFPLSLSLFWFCCYGSAGAWLRRYCVAGVETSPARTRQLIRVA